MQRSLPLGQRDVSQSFSESDAPPAYSEHDPNAASSSRALVASPAQALAHHQHSLLRINPQFFWRQVKHYAETQEGQRHLEQIGLGRQHGERSRQYIGFDVTTNAQGAPAVEMRALVQIDQPNSIFRRLMGRESAESHEVAQRFELRIEGKELITQIFKHSFQRLFSKIPASMLSTAIENATRVASHKGIEIDENSAPFQFEVEVVSVDPAFIENVFGTKTRFANQIYDFSLKFKSPFQALVFSIATNRRMPLDIEAPKDVSLFYLPENTPYFCVKGVEQLELLVTSLENKMPRPSLEAPAAKLALTMQ